MSTGAGTLLAVFAKTKEAKALLVGIVMLIYLASLYTAFMYCLLRLVKSRKALEVCAGWAH